MVSCLEQKEKFKNKKEQFILNKSVTFGMKEMTIYNRSQILIHALRYKTEITFYT